MTPVVISSGGDKKPVLRLSLDETICQASIVG